MRTIELSTAFKSLSAYAEEFGDKAVVLTWHGQAIAAVVSLKDIDPSLSLSLNPEFLQIIQQARDEFKAGKKLSLDEMKRDLR